MHPYKVYNIIPEDMPCQGVDPKFLTMTPKELDDWATDVYTRLESKISTRNLSCLGADGCKKFKDARSAAQTPHHHQNQKCR